MIKAEKFYRYSTGIYNGYIVCPYGLYVYYSDVGIAVGSNRFNYVKYTGSFHIIQELDPDNDYAGFIFGYQDNR